MKKRGPLILSVAFLVLLAAALAGLGRMQWLLGPGGDGTIGYLVTADNREFKVVQRYNDNWAEPYSVNFYHRTAGGPWLSEYIDHEATRWSAAEIVLHESTHSIHVLRNGELMAEFSLAELDQNAEAPQSE